MFKRFALVATLLTLAASPVAALDLSLGYKTGYRDSDAGIDGLESELSARAALFGVGIEGGVRSFDGSVIPFLPSDTSNLDQLVRIGATYDVFSYPLGTLRVGASRFSITGDGGLDESGFAGIAEVEHSIIPLVLYGKARFQQLLTDETVLSDLTNSVHLTLGSDAIPFLSLEATVELYDDATVIFAGGGFGF